ncbi:MAG: hypothetical protein LKK10_07610, partial [Prevotella sp.]
AFILSQDQTLHCIMVLLRIPYRTRGHLYSVQGASPFIPACRGDKPATGNCRFFSSLFTRRPQPYILYMVQPPLFLVTACLFYGNLFKELFLFSPPPVFIRKRLQR